MSDSKYLEVLYSSQKRPFTKYPKKLIKELVKKFNLNLNSSILELGCGRGEFLKEFSDLGMKDLELIFQVMLKNIVKMQKLKFVILQKKNYLIQITILT